MAKYIELEALMKYPIRIDHYDKEHGKLDFVLGIESVLEYAEALPAADVVEVVHGYWVERKYKVLWGDGEYSLFHCSECDTPVAREEKFCRNCGARMDGDGDG